MRQGYKTVILQPSKTLLYSFFINIIFMVIMKKFTLFAALLLVSTLMFGQKKVGLLIGAESVNDLTGDEKAAATWFQTAYTDGVVITPSTLSKIENVTTLWVSIDRVGIAAGWDNLPEAFRSDDAITAIKAHLAAGGSLLLTNHATQLVVPLERITYAPGIFGSGEGGQNPDIWGVHPVIGNVEGQIYDHKDHPIYKGMTYEAELFAGIYKFIGAGHKGDHNCMWDMNAISDLTENPNKIADFEDKTNSTVLGTWNHVVDYCCAGIIDFEPTTAVKGRILAVGLAAYEWDMNGGVNEFQDQLEMFTKNSLNYLDEKSTKTTTAINRVAADAQQEGEYYTLMGTKTVSPKAGLYIRNNKKVIVK